MAFTPIIHRWRSVLMQAAMWIVLLGVVGVAELLNLHLRHAMMIPLAEPTIDGRLTFAFPEHWKVSTLTRPGWGTTHVAVQPNGPAAIRTLSVTRQPIGTIVSPLQFLVLSAQINSDNIALSSYDLPIGGWPAQLVKIRSLNARGSIESESYLCCAVLPTREAITVRMDKPGVMDKADAALLRQMVDAMDLSDVPAPAPQPITFSNGITLTPSSDLLVYPESDALCVSRNVIWPGNNGQWISAEIIPFTAPHDQIPESLRWMLAHRELQLADLTDARDWLGADIVPESAGRGRIESASMQRRDNAFNRRAFWAFDPAGDSGVLVRFTATSITTPAEMQTIWQEIARGLVFGKPQPIEPLVQRGADALARIDQQPAREPAGDQWWIWSAGRQDVGWSREQFDARSQFLLRKTRRSLWDNDTYDVTQRWNSPTSSEAGEAEMVRYDSVDGRLDTFSFAALTSIDRDTVATQIRMPAPGRAVVAMHSPAFVRSERFPQILADLPDERLALWTDRFPGCEGDLLYGPILLLITPISDDSAPAATRPEPETTPSLPGGLRCMQVEVSGTGQLTRWYFRPDGKLDHTDLPGDLHLRPSTESDIKAAFADEPRLTPRGQ